MCYSWRVKKFLLILLMFVLPLQFTWAAAAVYCQHEQGNVSHFGHHTHQHSTGAVDGDAASDNVKIKKFHGDCEYCHMFSHATVLPALPALAPATPPGHFEAATARYTSPIPDTPKRPDWQLVA